MQTVLVAGGAGFIGSHLCERLLAQNYRVLCLDNLLTGDRHNIKQFEENPHFQFINQDLIKSIGDKIKPELPIDFIFHLASPASPNKKNKKSYMNFPIETLLVNSMGTYNLLLLAQEKHARFLFASTSEVYGDPKITPQSEDYNGNVSPNGPRSVYDEGKRFGEAATMAFVRKFNVDARIVRIFNTYGPRMQPDDGRVVSNFIMQAINNQPLTIYGDGMQTRSFCYISDLIDGLYKTMFTGQLAGEVINLGNPSEKKIEEFALLVKKITGTHSQIIYDDLPEDDPQQRCPDISKAKSLLSWEPKVTIEEGLKKTIEYFKSL